MSDWRLCVREWLRWWGLALPLLVASIALCAAAVALLHGKGHLALSCANFACVTVLLVDARRRWRQGGEQ